MLHYVHQLFANCVCVLVSAEQVVYSDISCLLRLKTTRQEQ